MSTAAYGAGKAGATFDPMTFVKKPQVVLKLMCFVSYDDNFKVVKVRNQSRYTLNITFHHFHLCYGQSHTGSKSSWIHVSLKGTYLPTL